MRTLDLGELVQSAKHMRINISVFFGVHVWGVRLRVWCDLYTQTNTVIMKAATGNNILLSTFLSN